MLALLVLLVILVAAGSAIGKEEKLEAFTMGSAADKRKFAEVAAEEDIEAGPSGIL